MSQDRELFNDAMLEGEYTTWTRVWVRDLGVGVNLLAICVDNLGVVYVTDRALVRTWIITRANVVTQLNNYRLRVWMDIPESRPRSISAKYVIADEVSVPRRMWVCRYGVLIWSVAWAALFPDTNALISIAMSANGRYIAVIFQSIATGTAKYVGLMEAL